METAIVPFSFMGAQVRVIDIDGVPWFVGRDVCELLGYTNPAKAMGDHCKGVTNRYPLATSGGVQEARVLTEGDVMRLVVASKMPAAVRFERFVFDVVLPQIRRTGAYAPPTFAVPQSMAEALRLAADLSERVESLEHEVAEQAPKVVAHDRIAGSTGAVCLRDAAKVLGISPNNFNRKLEVMGWIFRHPRSQRHQGYQDKIRAGLLETRTVDENPNDEGIARVTTQVRVTGKGMLALTGLLQREHAAAEQAATQAFTAHRDLLGDADDGRTH